MTFSSRLATFLFAGAAMAGCATFKSKPKNTLTMIYGAEYPADTAEVSGYVARSRDIMKKNQGEIPGVLIGDGKSVLPVAGMGHAIRPLKKFRVNAHNMIINFHAAAEMDTTENHIFYRDNDLKNHVVTAKDRGLSGNDLIGSIGNNMMATFPRYDHLKIAYYPCHGASVLSRVGELPHGSQIWIASDANGLSTDYHICLMQSFAKEKPWNQLGQDYFIETAILLQNSTVAVSDTSLWQRGGSVAVVADGREARPVIAVDDKRIELGRRRVYVIDLIKNAVTLNRDFSMDELKNEGKKLRPLIPMMQRAGIDAEIPMRKIKNYIPDDSVLYANRFDENLIDITVEKLSHIKNVDDFNTTMTDPEQRMASVLAYRMYSKKENITKVTPLPAYIHEHLIVPIEKPAPVIRRPRYEPTRDWIPE